ncbi:MAG: SGNH/GDSL hydrolase family protein, partial [Desulfobacterales bacterium]
IDAGARNFLVLTLPDLSKTPAFNQLPEDKRAQISELTQGFNKALSVSLEAIEFQNSGVSVVSLDAFSLMNSLINQGIFNNTTGTYLELDAEGNPTGNVNGDAEDFLFYDPIHPTTRAHAIIGEEAAAAVETDPGPRDFDDSDTCFIKAVAAD